MAWEYVARGNEMTRAIPYKANKTEVVGDGEKPRSFPSGDQPRMFADKSKSKVVQ